MKISNLTTPHAHETNSVNHGTSLYAFGYGLSYTDFEVGKGKISKKSMKPDGSVKVTVPVTNTGDREGRDRPRRRGIRIL